MGARSGSVRNLDSRGGALGGPRQSVAACEGAAGDAVAAKTLRQPWKTSASISREPRGAARAQPPATAHPGAHWPGRAARPRRSVARAEPHVLVGASHAGIQHARIRAKFVLLRIAVSPQQNISQLQPLHCKGLERTLQTTKALGRANPPNDLTFAHKGEHPGGQFASSQSRRHRVHRRCQPPRVFPLLGGH